LRRGSEEPSRERCLALVGNHGEASADYLDRCKSWEKVARVFKKSRKKEKSRLAAGFYLSGSLRRQNKAKDLHARTQFEHS
jgi:hypothetical protein